MDTSNMTKLERLNYWQAQLVKDEKRLAELLLKQDETLFGGAINDTEWKIEIDKRMIIRSQLCVDCNGNE